MKTLILQTLLACTLATQALAGATNAIANDANDIAAIRQISVDMGDAMVAGDVDKLDQMFADNWVAMGSSGKVTTKENMLRDFKTGKDKLQSFELTPIDVQVYGNVAVAHGGVTEKRVRNGQDTSGQYVWMDLLEKRNDKWVVVQSAGHAVK
ncbi:MAG TPA: nuclear transport factor 2 family protein [Rudaea sp.]